MDPARRVAAPTAGCGPRSLAQVGPAPVGRRRAAGAARTHPTARGARAARALTLALLYTLPSLWLFRHNLAHPATRTNTAGLRDPALFEWWLAWAPHALAHAQDPFFTHLANAPSGVSSLWNTSMLAAGVVLAPVTELFGPVASLNVLLAACPALTACTAHRWLRRWTDSTPPAAVGALVFGYSPFVVAESLGHPHLSCLLMVPVMLRLLEDLLWRARQPLRAGLLLALAVVVQFWLGTEVLLITALGAGVAAVLTAASRPRLAAARLRVLAGPLAAAAALAGALLALPLIAQFRPSGRLSGTLQPLNHYVGVPADLVLAPAGVLLHTHASAAAAVQYVGRAENGLYLGLPLLVLLAVLVAAQWRRIPVRIAAAVAVAFVVLSFGARLRHPGGRLGQALPWGWLQEHVTLVDNVLPVRLALVLWASVAFLLATGLDRGWMRWPSARRRGLLGLVTAACLLPVLPATVGGTGQRVAPTPRFFTTSAVDAVPAGSTALLVPMPTPACDLSGLLWQAAAGFRFAQVGSGFAHASGPRRRASFTPSAQQLSAIFSLPDTSAGFTGPLSGADVSEVRAALAQDRVRTIVVGPSAATARQVALVTQLMGRPADLVSGGVWLWYV